MALGVPIHGVLRWRTRRWSVLLGLMTYHCHSEVSAERGKKLKRIHEAQKCIIYDAKGDVDGEREKVE